MAYGWAVAAILLAGLIGLLVLRRRLLQELKLERRNVLELQRELSVTIGELSDVKTRRKRLLAASTQALIIVEKDHRVSSANKVARSLFGPLDKERHTFIEWTRKHQLLEMVDQVLAGQKTPTLYFSMGNKFLEANTRSIKFKKEVVAVALAIHDVTELQRLSRARRDFVTNISHELRTPLASIQLLLDTLLNKEVLDDKSMTRTLIDRITVQVETLSQLAQELMDLSLIESGKVPLKMASYPLRHLVEKQIEKLQPQAERKNIAFNLMIPPEVNVLVDKTMIGRVVSNLLHNALKFTDAGEVIISARRCTETINANGQIREEDWVTVGITDTGVGVAPDELPRIFERFYKTDRARDRKRSGTGLGLAISKHIVEAHGGRIWAENNKTHAGSTFYFNLPVED